MNVGGAPDFKINTARLMKQLKPYLIAALDQATDEFVNAMKRHAQDTVTPKSPGDKKWRGELDRDIKK